MYFFRLACIAIVLVCAGVFASSWYYKEATPPIVGKSTYQGDSLIGGSFTLTDQDGQERSSSSFLGKYAIVYFGYTFCPDVCPFGLHNFTEAMKTLDPKLTHKIQPLFITIDPKRDNQQMLKRFIGQFYPGFIGLTGSEAAIKKACDAYRVFVQIQPPHHGSEHYIIDHSSIFYIMSPQGKYLGHFTHVTPPQEMAKKIKEFVQ